MIPILYLTTFSCGFVIVTIDPCINYMYAHAVLAMRLASMRPSPGLKRSLSLASLELQLQLFSSVVS